MTVHVAAKSSTREVLDSGPGGFQWSYIMSKPRKALKILASPMGESWNSFTKWLGRLLRFQAWAMQAE